ncbi:MAG: 2-C-methyl-D-erythritol 2,4-cyclodiphosphate synthase [Cyclobacteriaceae bacterium]|nr:2-C-methyl-D-erythritol 2,4-cyclodiphosphate synthase [Cyclobacteriaceae bacterium]
MKIRVGFGFDVHPLESGKDLWLGGLKLPAAKGAVGHSDADVLIHAICDALLGAANLGDIGTHFVNTDARWAGKESSYFLGEVTRMVLAKGWTIENVDCTVTLEMPKLKPHIPAMKRILAPLMNISEDDISIKATTNEKLGYVGRTEGLNAYAVALIARKG